MENDVEPATNLTVVGPISEERYHRLHAYLSENGRHDLIQIILGHPEHLVTRQEFDYYLSDFEGTIDDVLAELVAKDILTQYQSTSDSGEPATPRTFWGLSSNGLRVIRATGHLKALPILRPIHEHTHKPDHIKRLETVPRPALPASVADALTYDEPTPDEEPPPTDENPSCPGQVSLYADALDDATTPLDDEPEDGRSLDELF